MNQPVGKDLTHLLSIDISRFPTAKLHQHDEAQLSYMQKGVLKVIANHRVYIVPAGFTIYIPPGITHGIECGQNIDGIILYFDKNMPLLPTDVTISKPDELIKQLILKVHQQGKYKTNVFTQALLQAMHDDKSAPNYALSFPTHPLLRDLIAYIDDHLSQPVSIDAIAQKAHLSARHLSRIFKKETGLSFSYWLQQYKMLYALILLPQHQSTSIVARALGYDSDSAFINTFKKFTHGKPPSFFY
ncbi:AraC family transcriptional regulator [Cysteiniphilum halobium]|uniref:AraC family transcriptional regulator n=1 Tax=Cysteiniphilum halobium TaxID=2219059 RepID=UPI000E656EAE|nr:AraC family transcriptional regulator [Cysteiniphilum halobium]